MDDLIRRQDAIEELSYLQTYLFDSRDHDKKVSLEDVRYAIEQLPSAQQWIPCSERLPEKPNMYTVTDSKGDVVRFVFTGTESSRKYWQRCAKAWMPLPEPYKEESNEKNL